MVQSLLFRWKSCFITFHYKSRSQSLKEEWRGSESRLLEVQRKIFHSFWWFERGVRSSAAVDPLAFLKSRINVEIYQEIIEYLVIHLHSPEGLHSFLHLYCQPSTYILISHVFLFFLTKMEGIRDSSWINQFFMLIFPPFFRVFQVSLGSWDLMGHQDIR